MNENQITKGQIFEKPNANAVGAHDCARINNNKLTANVVGVAASYACDICNSRRSNSYPNSDPHSKGITLVALIITIIIMLILVAVSITIAIKGDLFGITKQAAKKMTIEGYIENLEAIRVNAMMEQIKNNLTTVEFMDKVEEGITASKVFEERQNLKKTSKSVKVTTKEGYLFKITENKVMYMGLADEQGELTLDLVKDKNTFFTYDPSTPTKGPVKVAIDISVDEEELGAILEYSTDGSTWQEYTGPVALNNNGDKIYARLYSEEEDEVGSVAEDAVGNIDRLSPKQFVPTATAEGYYNIKLEGNTTDSEASSINGSSGIKAYYYSKDNGETWEPQNGTTDTSYTFEKLKDGQTYTGLKMKAVDNAGNEIITEKQITVTLPEAPKPHVGDYIEYTPDTVEAPYTLYGKYSGYGTYTSHVLTSPTDQEISQDKLNWQILKIYEDGSMDIIGSPTTDTIYFQGALGYNNGVYLMHDICKTLYSKSSRGVEARSVSLEDFEDEDLIEEGADWKESRDGYEYSRIKYGDAKTYTGAYSYYPKLYARENGSGIGVEIESTDTEEQIKAKLKQNGIKSAEKYYTAPTEETYSQANDSKLTMTNTYYYISISDANYGEAKKALYNFKTYWVASRCVLLQSNIRTAHFRIHCADSSLDARVMIDSGGVEDKYEYCLRPVVHLGSSIQLELSDSATSENYPHKIISY